MSCCSNCGSDPCGCAIPSNCAQNCECPDPGSLSAGRHLSVLDYKLCEKRLTNAQGILVNNMTGSGAGSISWTQSPCGIALPSLAIAEGVQIDNFLAAIGDSLCWYRILPDGAANGYLKAEGGKWIIGDIPTATIPDPLTVSTLNVNTTATIKNLIVTTGLCFSSLASGAVVEPVGLSAAGCLIKQSGTTTSPLGVSVALYYENSSETSTSVPNALLSNSQYAQIPNEIANSSGIASIQAVDTIKILIAGQYIVNWGCAFAYPQNVGDVNLNLEINGAATPIPGEGPVRTRTNAASTGAKVGINGFTVKTFAVNDTLKLKVESDAAGTTGIHKVKLMLTRISA